MYKRQLLISHTSHSQSLHLSRCSSSLSLGHSNRTNCSVRADIRTSVTLDTVFSIPYRDINCNTTFLVCRSSGRSSSIYIILECRYRQGVTFLSRYFSLDVVNKVNSSLSSALCMSSYKSFISCILPAFRNFDLYNLFCSLINSSPVLSNDIITLTSVDVYKRQPPMVPA